MAYKSLSVIVQCWPDTINETLCLKVTRVDTAQVVALQAGVFVLRFTTDETDTVRHCQIQHVASGREAYVLGNAKLQAFVLECVLGKLQASPSPTSTLADSPTATSNAKLDEPTSEGSDG